MITTNKIPKSFRPMNKIENGGRGTALVRRAEEIQGSLCVFLGIYHRRGDHAALRRVAGKLIGTRRNIQIKSAMFSGPTAIMLPMSDIKLIPNAPKEKSNDR